MKEYKTTDIILASVLRMAGADLIGIEVDAKSKGTFTFANVSEDFINDYMLGKTRIEPVTFNNTLKQLVTAVRAKIHG